jgi:hypothetical protein
MTILVLRPDSWNFPLLLHVAGAMLLVGAVTVAAGSLLLAWSGRDSGETATLTRFGFRTFLLAVIPSYFLMRIGAEWMSSKEDLGNSNATWVGIGYAVADLGALLIIVATVLTGLSSRRLGRQDAPVGPSLMGRISTGIAIVLLAAYVVAIWAMSAKPD